MINEERLLEIFFDLARIYSPSRNEISVADYITGFATALGYKVFEDDSGKAIHGNTGNLVISIDGTVQGPSLMYAAHMDTVEPGEGIEPYIENGIIYSRGDTILAADDKAGCAAMLELLAVLTENEIEHTPVHLVFTVAEEIGLLGAKNFDPEGINVDYCYVLDAHGPLGTIITEAPYQDSFEAKFTGKSAHAGVEPENGISAILAASKAVSLMKLGRIDDETTANIGFIEGGRAINIVPDETHVYGECRSLRKDKLKAQADHMIDCFKCGAHEVGAEVVIEQTRPYNGFSVDANSEVVTRLVKSCDKLGIETVKTKTGGGSDANIFSERGITTVTMSIGFEDVHTINERQSVRDLVNLSRLLLTLAEV